MATNKDFLVRNGLQVRGNAVVGAYSLVNVAPQGGMLISGNVGIGTATVNICNTQVQGETGARSYWTDATVDYVQPALNFDFINSSSLDPRLTFTRASNATAFTNTGSLTTYYYNQPRFDYDPNSLQPQGFYVEESRTNSIRNNTMQGAVVGSPGTLPTNWTTSGLGTLNTQVVAIGTLNGISYIDIRYYGTTSTTGGYPLIFEPNNVISAAQNDYWTESAYIALVGGSLANVTVIQFDMVVYPNVADLSGGSFLSSITTSLTRVSSTIQINVAGTTNIQPRIVCNWVNGASVDFTLRIGLPQLEKGQLVTSAIPTYGAAATRSQDLCNIPVGSWYNQSAGTLYTETNRQQTNASFCAALYNSPTNYIGQLYVAGSGRTYTGQTYAANAAASISSSPGNVSNVDFGTNMRATVSFDSSNVCVTTTKGQNTPFSNFPGVPAVSYLVLGARGTGGDFGMTGYIRKLAYYPNRLSNATCATMTMST